MASKKELDYTAEEKSKYKENHRGLKINVFLSEQSLSPPDVKSGQVLRFLALWKFYDSFGTARM